MECAFCGTKLNIKTKIMRKDTCPHCGRDLRCCKQCKFYDPHAYNECKEVMAERIVDKERANFCEYFVLKGASGGKGKTAEAREALEALFTR
ncbi:MAG: hypothetical protein R6U38_13400 [Desulfatiglandaceae bacterium]